MKNVIKTTKTLEIVWPFYALAQTVCSTLDRLEEDLISYWEPYWDYDEEKIGIRFASEEGVIEALPGSVVTVEDEYAVSMRKTVRGENSLTTRIDEKKRAVAYIYDSEDLEDLKALSGTGRRIELKEGRVRVDFCDVPVDVTNSFVVEEPDKEGLTWFHKDSNENTAIEDIARHYEGKLV